MTDRTPQQPVANDMVERLRVLMAAATPGPYRAHDHNGMASVGADPADWVGYGWVGRIRKDSGPNGEFDAGWLDVDRRKDGLKEYRERASADVHFVAEALNALPQLLEAAGALASREAAFVNDIAVMMSEFVDNWPPHKKAETSIALAAKTLRASRDEVAALTAELASLKRKLAEAESVIGRAVAAIDAWRADLPIGNFPGFGTFEHDARAFLARNPGASPSEGEGGK